MLFIVIHQVYELWFKQLLHELDRVVALLGVNDAVRAQHTLKRILTILKVMVAQLDILETMTPLEFLSFRSRLEAASGFQSDQFRQIEFILAQKSRAASSASPPAPALVSRWNGAGVSRRSGTQFLHYLKREGYAVPEAQLDRDPVAPVQPSAEVQQILVEIYRRDPKNSEMCERLVDLDEGVQEWRYRHVKMVERTIGTRKGTGGSSGAKYLSETVGRPVFPDLWEIRGSL